jgi:glutaminyl-peptide cyclotransferase
MRIFSFFFLPFLTFLMLGAACNQQGDQNRAQITNVNTANVNGARGGGDGAAQNGAIPTYGYEIVKTYNHDPKAFTQGLVFHDGFLIESTGNPDYKGQSGLRRVNVETGETIKEHKLDKQYFAEGMTVLNGKIYQITWMENVCFVYDAATFAPAGQMKYIGEGWGLTNDGTNLIMSDGSHILKFVDPSNFRIVRTITALNDGKPLYNLNELEFVKGEIWANIWHSEEKSTRGLPNIGKPNTIARIDPNTGKVVGWINLDKISPEDTARDSENTLNGIAYDSANDRIFVTGKQWRKLFEIKLKPKNS